MLSFSISGAQQVNCNHGWTSDKLFEEDKKVQTSMELMVWDCLTVIFMK